MGSLMRGAHWAPTHASESPIKNHKVHLLILPLASPYWEGILPRLVRYHEVPSYLVKRLKP